MAATKRGVPEHDFLLHEFAAHTIQPRGRERSDSRRKTFPQSVSEHHSDGETFHFNAGNTKTATVATAQRELR